MWDKGLNKGNYGYINRYRKRVFLISGFLLILSISVFLLGFLSTGTKKNFLSIIAVVGILPAAKFVVYFIISCKFKTLTLSEYERIKEFDFYQLYDLFYTTSDMNIMMNACAMSNEKVIFYTKDKNLDKKKAISLLTEEFKTELGLERITIIICSDLEGYRMSLSSELSAQDKNNIRLEQYLIHASL